MSFISPTANDRELTQQLLEDARLLEGVFTSGRPTPVFVRTTFVPILRKWIVEDGFFKAVKLLRPHEPMFELLTVPNAIKLCKAGVYEHWMAMIMFGTMGVGSGLLAEKHRANPPNEFKPVTVSHPASMFFKQKMFFWKGNFYTRHDIIWMHANRLGGVHLDFRRGPNETHIDEIKNYFGFEILPHAQQMLVGPEIGVARADPARRDCIYDAMELVAIDTAQIFAKGISASRAEFQAVIEGPKA